MIPKVAHFIWIGESLDWPYLYSLASAYDVGEFNKVILHHTDKLDDEPVLIFKKCYPYVVFNQLQVDELFLKVDGKGNALLELYDKLLTCSAKSNLIRFALLYVYGGVYLDLDTITLKPFDSSFYNTKGFFGKELGASWIEYDSYENKRPQKVKIALLEFFRFCCAKIPHGWKLFLRFKMCYFENANNAVLGAVPGAAWLDHLLNISLMMPVSKAVKRHQLGPRLLHRESAVFADKNIKSCGSDLFYAFPPLIAQHWFRRTDVNQFKLALGSSFIAHWYSNNLRKRIYKRRLLKTLDPEEIINYADTIPFCNLVSPYAKKFQMKITT